MRLFLTLVLILLPSLTLAQADDSLRTYEGKDVTIEEHREHESAIKGAAIRNETVASVQAKNGATRISELAQSLSPSLSDRKYGTLGGISLLSFRGLPPEYTVIYRDGIRLTNEQNSLTDLARVSASSVERIELLPTGSSILLGGDAIGAAINLVSPDVLSDRVSLGTSSLAYHGLTPAEVEHSLAVSTKLTEKWGILLSGTRQYSPGDYPFWHEVSQSEVRRENNDAQLHDLLLRIQRYDDATPVTFTASHVRARRGAPGPVTVRDRGASAFLARQNDEDLLLAIQSSIKLGRWSFLPALSYQSQYEEYKDAPKQLDEHYDNRLYAVQLRANANVTEDIGFYTGASLQRSTLESNEISTSSMPFAERNRLSVYAASAMQVHEALQFTTALRVEHLSDRGTLELLPQASLKYRFLHRFTIDASYGASYHAPTLNQLHWKTLGNSNLRSEHAENGEVSIAYQESLMGMFDMNVSLNAFHLRSHDQILWLAAESNLQRPVNVQDSRTQGIELMGDLQAELSQDLHIAMAGGFTLLDAVNITEGSPYYGKRLPYSAQRQLQMNGLIASRKWGTFGVISNYRGLKYSDLGNTDDRRLFQVTIIDASYTAPDVTLVDHVSLRLQFSMQNVTDRRHYEVHSYPLPERTIQLSTQLIYQPTQPND